MPTFNTPNSTNSYAVPSGVTKIQVEVRGGDRVGREPGVTP